jgi:hypothetical protein
MRIRKGLASVLVIAILMVNTVAAFASGVSAHDQKGPELPDPAVQVRERAVVEAKVRAVGGLVLNTKEELINWIQLRPANEAKAHMSTAGRFQDGDLWVAVPRSALGEVVGNPEDFATDSDGEYILLKLSWCAKCVAWVPVAWESLKKGLFYDIFKVLILWALRELCDYCRTLIVEETTEDVDICSYCGAEGRLFELFSCDQYVRSGCNTCGAEIWSYNPYW